MRSKALAPLRRRLKVLEKRQADLRQLRAFMEGRRYAHDLAFLDGTAGYMAWLERELVDVRAELDGVAP